MRRQVKALLLIFSAVVSHAAGLNFPTVNCSVSPDLKWQVRCVTEKVGNGFLHNVILSPLAGGKEVAIWQSTRSCDVLWSKDSRYLAITDWTGSGESEIWLVAVSVPEACRLKTTHLDRLVPLKEREGHFYYEALRWESDHRLAVRCFGHTDENPSHGFAYYFSVDAVSGAVRLVNKEDKEPDLRLERSAGQPAALGLREHR